MTIHQILEIRYQKVGQIDEFSTRLDFRNLSWFDRDLFISKQDRKLVEKFNLASTGI